MLKKLSLRLLAPIVLLGSCLALGGGTDAQADSTTPTYVASYTGNGKHVNGEIAHLIEQAQRGDSVRVALFIARMYSGDPHNPPTYQDEDGKTPPAIWLALRHALDNGAKVEIVTEGSQMDDARNTPSDQKNSRKKARTTRSFFVELEAAGADVTYCQDGCIRSNRNDSLNAINHHKFFLLDYARPTDLKGWKRIVVQSSANVHSWGDKAFEQSVAFDAKFYNNVWTQYSRRFDEMKSYWRDGKDSLGMAPPTSWRQVTAFIGPYSPAQQRKGQDEYLSALNRIKSGKNCRVSIVMGHWSPSRRGKSIVNRLNRLVDMGCSVDTIVGDMPLVEAARKGLQIKFELEYQPYVHAKFMLLRYDDTNRAKQGKDPMRALTYAGSHNFTKGSWFSDDDAFVRVDQRPIYDDFCRYFDKIESTRSKIKSEHAGKQAKGGCASYL